MSTLKLDAPMKSFLEAANAQDASAVACCFTDNALVTDEGRDRRGTAAIRDWAEEVSRKYRPTVEALLAVAVNGRMVVTGRVSGDFPGSPVDLRYDFSIDGQKITRLEIAP